MEFKRVLRRAFIPGAREIETIKNMVDEGSFKGGLEKTFREDCCEDNPIGKKLYEYGKYDGKKEGYVEASDEYEQKLLNQANEFLKQKEISEKERDAYEELLDEYEKAIDELEAIVDKTQSQVEYLNKLYSTERKLQKIAG